MNPTIITVEKTEDYNSVKKEWEGMIPVQRYEHFTLFAKVNAEGKTLYFECFHNFEVDKYNGKIKKASLVKGRRKWTY